MPRTQQKPVQLIEKGTFPKGIKGEIAKAAVFLGVTLHPGPDLEQEWQEEHDPMKPKPKPEPEIVDPPTPPQEKRV